MVPISQLGGPWGRPGYFTYAGNALGLGEPATRLDWHFPTEKPLRVSVTA